MNNNQEKYKQNLKERVSYRGFLILIYEFKKGNSLSPGYYYEIFNPDGHSYFGGDHMSGAYGEEYPCISRAVWRVDYRLCEDFDEAETDDDFAFRHDLEYW